MRLEHYSTGYREQQSVQPQLPLFQQRSIQAKMRKFHPNMATLDTLTCPTCSDRYPGLHFHSKSNEYLCCSHDKHIPMVYSFANNMNPGPNPPQLQVSNTDTCMHFGALTYETMSNGMYNKLLEVTTVNPCIPSFLSCRHSCEKRYQALSCFSVLKATEFWARPGNEAMSAFTCWSHLF